MPTFYEGTVGGIEAVALFSGVCKVNAAIAAPILIDTYGVDHMINAGTAGGMAPGLAIFDSVIATETAYYDVAPDVLTEFHPWLKSVYFKSDQELLDLTHQAVDRMDAEGKVYWGQMVTGEAFVADEGRQTIHEQFAPLTVDMEIAGIAHVCYVNSIPFIAVRSITDTAAHSGTRHFEENCQKASAIAKDITVALLEELHRREGNGLPLVDWAVIRQ